MGLGDMVSKILVEFKGDTSDLKSKLKDLTGVERERTKALIDDIEKQNKGYDGAITKLGHVGLALDTLGKAYDAAKDAMKVYGTTLRLEAATSGINIEKLSESFGGLITKHELMTMAAQTATGVLKLNQGQMETLGQAALALKNRGFELEDALKKLTDAAVKGKVEGLDDLGLSIKAGSSNAQTLRNMMTELNKVIKEGSTAANDEADAVQRLGVKWDDAAKSIKGYVAQAILAASVDISPESLKKLYNDEKERRFKANFASDETLEVNRQIAIGARRGMAENQNQEVIEFEDDDRSGDVRKMQDDRKKKAEERRRKLAQISDKWATGVLDEFEKKLEADIRGGNSDGSSIQSSDWAINRDMTTKSAAAMFADEEKAKKKGLKQQRMDALFGPIEEIDLYTEAFGRLGATFDALGESVGAGYEAIVTGQGGATAAIKKMFADNMMAIGKSSAIEALKEGAHAIASFATGNFAGGALHLKAAGMHAAVAVAAGAAAHSIGTSAQVAASDKAAEAKAKEEEKQKKEADKKSGKGGSGGLSRTDENGRTVIIAYLDPWAQMTGSERGRNARQMVNTVLGGSGGEDS
jgi:hypothetical protein